MVYFVIVYVITVICGITLGYTIMKYLKTDPVDKERVSWPWIIVYLGMVAVPIVNTLFISLSLLALLGLYLDSKKLYK